MFSTVLIVLQILLDEQLALEVANDWSSVKLSSGDKGKIAIKNFHILRRATKNVSAMSMLPAP